MKRRLKKWAQLKGNYIISKDIFFKNGRVFFDIFMKFHYIVVVNVMFINSQNEH